MSAVGFEPTSANTVELESTPLDRSGTLTDIHFIHTHPTKPINNYIRTTHTTSHKPSMHTTTHCSHTLNDNT